jgi:hypothetical protein
LSLASKRWRTAVLGESPARAEETDSIGIIEHVGVWRGVLLVTQRRDGARSSVGQFRSAQLDRKTVRRRMRVLRIMASRARHFSGCRQRLVEKHFLPDLRGEA